MRQQSIAVLPPPMTTTRLPIFSTWPKATEVSQSMPMWMFFDASLPAGNIQILAARCAGADEDRVEAFREDAFEALHLVPKRRSTPKPRMRSTSSSSTWAGQAERRNVGAHQAAALGILFNRA